MGNDLSRTHYQGLLVPHPDARIWYAESSYSEADPRPGVPVPVAASSMALASSGRTITEAPFEVRSQGGGFPGAAGASFIVRPDGEDEWLGWDPPVAISDFEVLLAYAGSDSPGPEPDYKYVRSYNPHAVALPDGTVIVCAAADNQTLYYSHESSVTITVRDPVTKSWSYPFPIADLDATSNDPSDRHPCLVALPSGRVLCYSWIWEDSGLEYAQVRMDYSDDAGVTWVNGSMAVLPDPVATDGASYAWSLGRLRAAYGNGQILLIAQLQKGAAHSTYADDRFRQYASSDLGNTFILVNETEDEEEVGGRAHDIVWTGTAFLVSWLRLDSGDMRPTSTLLGSAVSVFDGGADTSIYTSIGGSMGDYITPEAADLATCVDSSGVIYCYLRWHGASTFGLPMMSRDGGASWEAMGRASLLSYSTWFDPQTSTNYPHQYAAVCVEGRVCIVHAALGSSGSTVEEILMATWLGGWTTNPHPGDAAGGDLAKRLSWSYTWLPFVMPNLAGWTASGVAATLFASSGTSPDYPDQYLSWSSSSSPGYYYRAPASTVDQGTVVEWTQRVPSGGSTVGLYAGLHLVLDSGLDGYGVTVACSTTGFQMHDLDGGSSTSIVSVDLTERVDFRVAQAGNEAAIWYRPRGADAWVEGGRLTLGNTSGAWNRYRIAFGRLSSGTSAMQLWGIKYTEGATSGAQEMLDLTSPGELLGRPHAGVGRRTYAHDGTYLSARSGPTFRGEEWYCEPAYGYALERATDLSQPSPRVDWRSQDLNAQTIAIEIDGDGDASKWGSEVVGISITNTNIPTFEVWGKRDGGWVLLDTINTYIEVSYYRYGASITPQFGEDPIGLYVRTDELAGWWLCRDYDTPADVGRSIAGNSEGSWDPDAVRPHVRLVGVDESDDNNQDEGALVPKDVTLLIDTRFKAYEGFKLVVPAAASVGTGTSLTPPESYWRIGTLVVGPVSLFAQEYSWGRTIDTEANVETVELGDGTSRTRVRGPASRSVEFAWSDGVDSTRASDGADPDFVQYGTHYTNAGYKSAPTATVDGTAWTIEGLLQQTQGAHRPVVYLPRIEQTADEVVLLNRRHDIMLSRMTSPVRLEVDVGDEDVDEHFRIASITLAEVT